MTIKIEHPSLFTDAKGQVWFKEDGSLWPGQAMTLRVEEVLHHEKSLFQDVLFFKSTDYGNVLVLDGVIQATERDEFSYQEMIAHLPLNAHPCPKNVLVIGGGDGGVLREVVKHQSVESVTLCEIDEAVVRLSKIYLREMAAGFDHEKVTVFIGDGFEFLKNKIDTYDVIITDSSDPVGPAESLFQPTFFELLKNALKPDGILCSQGECQWLHLDIIKSVLAKLRSLFPVVDYAYTTIPTYPSGQIGFFMASKNGQVDLKRVNSQNGISAKDLEQLRYYSPELHSAAFVLPNFTRKALADI